MNKIENSEAMVYDSINENYDVSICVPSYNNGRFLSELFSSILDQITTCSYEIVVGDNNSTDDSRAIIMEYYNRYPDVFCIILNRENLGITTNKFNNFCKAKGKYIVPIDSDDYFIDRNKLQRQFDFLESNKKYVGVSNQVEIRYEYERTGRLPNQSRYINNSAFTLKDFLNNKLFAMSGMMFRNSVFSNNYNHFLKMVFASKKLDDASFCILLLQLGDIYCMENPTIAYRVFRTGNNAVSYNAKLKYYDKIYITLELYCNLDKLTGYKLGLFKIYSNIFGGVLMSVIKGRITKKDLHSFRQLLSKRYAKQYGLILFCGFFIKIHERLFEV